MNAPLRTLLVVTDWLLVLIIEVVTEYFEPCNYIKCLQSDIEEHKALFKVNFLLC